MHIINYNCINAFWCQVMPAAAKHVFTCLSTYFDCFILHFSNLFLTDWQVRQVFHQGKMTKDHGIYMSSSSLSYTEPVHCPGSHPWMKNSDSALEIPKLLMKLAHGLSTNSEYRLHSSKCTLTRDGIHG